METLGGEKRSIRLLVAHGVSSKALGIARYKLLSKRDDPENRAAKYSRNPEWSFCKKGNCIERA